MNVLVIAGGLVFLNPMPLLSIHEVQSIYIAVISASHSTEETKAEKRGMTCAQGDNVNAEMQFRV